MPLPNNVLQQVITYNDAKLSYLQNLNCFVATLNTKYKDFQNTTANLGDTINLELPTRAVTGNGLVASFQGVEQRLVPLICDQAAHSAMAFSTQQFIFNVKDYMEKFGKARIQELSAKIEANVARNAISGVPVMTVNSQGQSIPTGALHTESGPYRFFGDGVTPINSFGQLAKMLALFRNYGAADGELDVYMDDIAVTDIVNTGLNQFVPARNEEMANSWDLGTYKGSNARFYQSNLLPIHYAGNVGNDGATLTLISVNADGTQLTFSGATIGDVNAIKSGDLGEFQDVGGSLTNLRYLTFVGHEPSKNKVQIRVTADAEANDSGHVVLNVTPALISTPGDPNQNLNTPLVAGMQLKILPSHRAGLVVGGKAFYLAMPKLDDQEPFPTASQTDPDTGVSLRSYYGTRFGQNQKGHVDDCVWTALAIPEYTMRVAFPL